MNKFDTFMLEASRSEIRQDTYFICNANFRNIRTKMPGKIIKNIGVRVGDNFKYFYKFTSDENIIITEDGVNKETNTFELSEYQIRSLKRLSRMDLENFNNGIRLTPYASEDFIKVARWFKPNHTFYEWSYFDLVDDKNISYLSYIDDPNVPANEKYTSKLRKIATVGEVYYLILNNCMGSSNNPYLLQEHQRRYHNFMRKKQGIDVLFTCTPSFKFLLNGIKFKVKYETYDVGFFDVTNDENTISFLPKNKIKDVQRSEIYTSKSRQVSKVGRVLKKLNDDYNEQDIDNFVTKYKTEYNIKYKYDLNNVKLVVGNDISSWYKLSNYAKGNGTLNNSCMRYEYPQVVDRVRFYSKYPDKIALCILVDDYDKLLARALVWRLDEPKGIIFMDRIYGITPHHESILKRYADINHIQTKFDGYNNIAKLKVELEDFKNKHKFPLPYLDTLKQVYNQGNNIILSNK